MPAKLAMLAFFLKIRLPRIAAVVAKPGLQAFGEERISLIKLN